MIAGSDDAVVVSNYPRGQVAEVRGDVTQLRELEEAFFICNRAVLLPLVVGIGVLACGSGLPFEFVSLVTKGAGVAVVLLTGFLIRPAVETYCDAKGHGRAQRLAYLLSSALMAPFCIGFLVIASLQSNIMGLLVSAGVVGEKERLNRKRIKTTLDLVERNQRMSTVALNEEKV